MTKNLKNIDELKFFLNWTSHEKRFDNAEKIFF